MTIAYLVNQYPQSSHSFIRREIAALEGMGLTVHRFTLRHTAAKLVDEGDARERQRTRAVLAEGGLKLVGALLKTFIAHPVASARALRLGWRIGRRSQVGVFRHLIYLAEACVLRGWLKAAGVDHLHAHFGTNSTTVAMLCHALGGPGYSFTVHGPEEFDDPKGLSLGEKARRARFVVAVSSFGRSQLYRWCEPGDWAKIQIVHCGVDDLFLAAAAASPSAAARLVCVGRLAEQKGQLLLVRAAAMLAREGVAFELVLVGDGEMRPQIEAVIAEHGLGDRVRIAGWMSNEAVRQEMLAARALVLPSFAEGLPVVIMESLALGRPVISTYIAGIPELVEPGVTGWLTPAGDVDALAAAMRAALAAEPQELARMGRAGAERVAQQHSAKTEAAKLAEHFRNT